MESELEAALQRWGTAGLLDAAAIERIRVFEASDWNRRRARWPTIITVTFGALALAVGIVLFVSAHWDWLSPTERMSMLVLMLGSVHAAAAFFGRRNLYLGLALHATGTLTLGAAITIAGQIFNLDEHWPSAFLMWTIGAWAAWALLRHWSQLAIAAVLTPIWLLCEWTVAAGPGASREAPTAGALLCALCYLSARTPGRDSPAREALAWIGGLALLPAAIMATALQAQMPAQPDPFALAGWLCALLLPLGLAFGLRGSRAWMNVAAALWTVLLVVCSQAHFELALYAWCVAGAIGLVAWGIYEASSDRINLGMAGFALTLLVFFFSTIMDKLGRSASLIALGIVFLAGGWYWEKLRRRLVAGVAAGADGTPK